MPKKQAWQQLQNVIIVHGREREITVNEVNGLAGKRKCYKYAYIVRYYVWNHEFRRQVGLQRIHNKRTQTLTYYTTISASFWSHIKYLHFTHLLTYLSNYLITHRRIWIRILDATQRR